MHPVQTKFGSLQPLLKVDDVTVCELAKFHSEGSNHVHDLFETCYIQKGQGVIVEGDNVHKVVAGSVVKIPPDTPHRMIPEVAEGETWDILLVYSTN